MDWINKIKPGVPNYWLQLTAGLMWTGVGFLLINLAAGWIFAPDIESPWLFWLPGTVLAYVIFQFGFSRLARKNSQRIDSLPADKPCLFAFQAWHSYPLVLVMIGLGITLRKYTPIPKPLLGVLYIGIGGGLGISSLYYYWQVIQHQKRPPVS